jgi:four helix bundle protein
MNSSNQSFRDLTVYKKAFELAMKIFEVTKSFPKEERYSLTDQIRRSSRGVCRGYLQRFIHEIRRSWQNAQSHG